MCRGHGVAWHGQLELNYRHDAGRTVCHSRHQGPLRVLKSLYPEGPGICHQVVLHPPAGLVGGDELDIQLTLGARSHAVLTTPGATRFYRSEGATAVQRVHIALDDGARCEWLPLENIAYSGCLARNELHLALNGNAQAMGWDVVALGLPAAQAPFVGGAFEQCLHAQGIWLERGRLSADDRALLDSPLGLNGHRVMGTAWLLGGQSWSEADIANGLELARAALEPFRVSGLPCGATSPDARCLVVRGLADQVEPLITALQAVRSAWRQAFWALPGHGLRIWAT
jgi:urease accessory protein